MAPFVPRDRKKRRRKHEKTRTNEVSTTTNATEIVPSTKNEKEKAKKETENAITAEQPPMSAKKKIRLNKYIVNALLVSHH